MSAVIIFVNLYNAMIHFNIMALAVRARAPVRPPIAVPLRNPPQRRYSHLSIQPRMDFKMFAHNTRYAQSSHAAMIPYPIFEIVHPDEKQMDMIGRFRVKVWRGATEVNEELFPRESWKDACDAAARHWIVIHQNQIVGAARLTISDLKNAPDGNFWEGVGRELPGPIANLTHLVTDESVARKGVGKALNLIRIEAAKAAGARCAIGMATMENKQFLLSIGFVKGGINRIYRDRPLIAFYSVEKLFK